MDSRAHRGAFPEGDALLACGALPSFTGRQAQGLGNGVRAEEVFWAALGAVQVAGPGTPTVLTATAQQSCCASVLLVPRKLDAAFPLLPRADGNADAHLWPIFLGRKVLACLTFQALLIRQALAVGAGRPWVAGVEQAAQGWLTGHVWPAVLAVRDQAHALFVGEHGADAAAWRCLHEHLWLQECPEQEQWQRQQQACADCHGFGPVHPPHSGASTPAALVRILFAWCADLPAPLVRATRDAEMFLCVFVDGFGHAAILAEFRGAAHGCQD
ncbi:hypothetical protein SAMN05443639_107303 [Stigmatella erecta]|uniref:Uncharacterized protein n=1 Tax=Stigmatella erecta TaxID=83460 RepID=A0A1I0JI12_9BACT|nr:hypothetical protein SAMN05443639_107303 [Stigmatella erecta]